MSSPYLDQSIQNIQSLLAQGQLKKAYDLTKLLLEKYPNDRNLDNLKKEITKNILNQNRQVIEETLVKVEEFRKNENYTDALRELKQILNLDPQNKKLIRLYEKIQKKYKRKIEKLSENFLEEKRKKLDDLLKTDIDKLIEELYFLETKNPSNNRIKMLAQEYKGKAIERRIKEKSALLKSDKFQDINNLIESLKKIDHQNPKLLELEKSIKARVLHMHSTERLEYVYKGKEYLQTLLKLKKYDKAIKLCDEILSLSPSDKEIHKLRETAEKKYLKENNRETIEIIKSKLPNLKKQFKSNPANFVKI